MSKSYYIIYLYYGGACIFVCKTKLWFYLRKVFGKEFKTVFLTGTDFKNIILYYVYYCTNSIRCIENCDYIMQYCL